MDFTFTPEQEELRASVRRFLADKFPSGEVRRLIDTPEGYDLRVWNQMAGQLGLQGMTIPEELGGSGCTAVEQAIVFEEMGRALIPAPYFSTVALAGSVLGELGDPEACARWLPRIADGSLIATVGLVEENGCWDPGQVATTATRKPHGWALDGIKAYVIDGCLAELILVVARTDEGPGVFAVEADAPGMTRTPVSALDLTRKLASVELTGTPARRVGPPAAAEALARALDRAITFMVAEQAGAAQRCLDMAVDYAKLRVQFGRPIGSFQAIKHKCADMLLEVESAKSAARYAAWAAAESSEELPVAASVAKAYCSDALFHVAAENIQVHGGIGFTWEHDAHLYFRRAKASQLMFGDAAYHRSRIADLVGI